ncbi:uncharacterized protein LY89DRAFT_691972 [Mollisia scopiformis]|uniref:Uncharacterized protein n=1 Tax=Mollisia scopiformis TaxID=149040 RepID=A0A132B459_MOLSC|nr:uncharacterized protein LY89DRAFT_691972 [Mollisia scopiformis]KUJ07180.1 hypothetical protein LY89DRAFT_691972 [Mollisia scopiformis]
MADTQQQEKTQEHTARTYDGPDPREMLPPRQEGYRAAAIRESRIKDRPYKPTNSSLRIKIELDLEVEVDLYARVKGDVTIGLL